jgi:hypothetical protein
MGSPFSDASSAPRLEPPGFLLLNYGTRTPLVMLVVRVACGALVGHALLYRVDDGSRRLRHG